MSYSPIRVGFSAACTGLIPAAGPGTGVAGQQTEDMMEAVARRQVCAVGTMSMNAHERWGARPWMGGTQSADELGHEVPPSLSADTGEVGAVCCLCFPPLPPYPVPCVYLGSAE